MVMVRLLWFSGAQLLFISACPTSHDAVCNGNEYIISRDETITPPHLVEVSFDATPLATPAENVLYFGYNANDMHTWCSDTNDPDPYVIIHFTEPVFITSFLSSGTTNFAFSALSTYYLTNFTLEYANSTAEDYTYYTEQHSGNRKVLFFIIMTKC